MRYHRCKCGASEAWDSSMPPRPCQGCDECGTTLSSPHVAPKPHELRTEYDMHTGKPRKLRCRTCYEGFGMDEAEKMLSSGRAVREPMSAGQ